MKRNSTVLLLESFGCITPIPWIDNAPDFLGFTEPTLSVLQQAWQSFLNSGEQLEIIPDPEIPEELLVTNWEGFEIALNSNQDFIAYGVAVENSTPFGNATLITKFNHFALGEITIERFQFYFETFCQIAQVSPEHRNEWAYAAQQFNLPPEFVAAIQSN